MYGGVTINNTSLNDSSSTVCYGESFSLVLNACKMIIIMGIQECASALFHCPVLAAYDLAHALFCLAHPGI